MSITIELINGLKVGLEHLSFEDDEEEDEVSGVVILDILFLRMSFVSYK
jgi:hypothetical protein